MATYGLTLADAVWRFPYRAALVLVAAYNARHGGTGTGPDPCDRAVARARRRARAFLESHFTISP